MLQTVQRFANNMWRSKTRLIVIKLFISMIMAGMAVGILFVAPFIQRVISSEQNSDWVVNNCVSSISCRPEYTELTSNLLLNSPCMLEHFTCIVTHQFILTTICLFGIAIFFALLTFVFLHRIIAICPLQISKKSGLISDFKFVTTWVVIYGISNTIMQVLGLSGEMYHKLSMASAYIVFFIMLNIGAYGYEIAKVVIPRKK